MPGTRRTALAGLIMGLMAAAPALGQPAPVPAPHPTGPSDPDRPGSPETGWRGLSSPADAFSAGPGMGAWYTKAALPTARSEVSVGEAGGKVYAVGGFANGRTDQPLLEEYDPGSDSWRERAPMLRGANHVAVVGDGGRLYAFGGFLHQNYGAIADAAVYDPAADRWTALAPLPQPLGAAAAAVLDGRIHLVGGAVGAGFDDRRTVNTHYVYDPASNTWQQNAVPLPFPREHLNLIADNGRLYAIGGRVDSYLQNTATLYVLGRGDTAWRMVSLMPTARSGTEAALLDGRIFVFGGERFGGVFNETEMYDPASNRWSTLTPMPVGRHGTGAAVIGHMIYIPAGGPLNGGSAQTNANQAFSYP